MLKIFKRDKKQPEIAAAAAADPIVKQSLLQRLKAGLQRTRSNLGDGLARLLLGKKQIDNALFEEIETQLLQADVGVAATQQIMQELTARVTRSQLTDGDALYTALQGQLLALLQPVTQSLSQLLAPSNDATRSAPYVILVVGINGSGKTTTIGKLAKQLQTAGKSVILAAGDTFRAAAVEQLQIWGQRNKVTVVAQHTGADSASVIFDALQAAKARNYDVLIADTAGRLHTQHNLMEELKKIMRVMQKLDATAPHEVMLVLDAGIGQNALQQVQQFNQAIGVTGLCMTKLDGTAKGGILFAIAAATKIPIRLIGVGEGIDDLREFSAVQFVAALFD